jgi:hypothetical protein
MPDPSTLALQFAAGGMNAALNPANVPDSMYSRGVNVQLIDQRPTTRQRVKVLPIQTESEQTKNLFQCENFQGAMFYNPAKGQSQISFAQDGSRIMASVGGKRFEVIPKEIQPENNSAIVTEVRGVQDGNKNLHTAWWYQAENYAIVQDGEAATWIWNGFQEPFVSEGMNLVDKEASELANAATVGAYVHGRIVQVINSRQVIVGDIIHKTNLTDSENILETKEQVYWATGSYFSPPSSMGNVIAAGILPLRDTQHGHGDLMLHCEDGIFSLNLNLFPRENWVNTPMVKHVLLETGARGPYALALYDGDQFFRSRHGLQSLRSARGESQLLGNPLNPISEEVEVWLNNDYESFVRFTSVAKWAVSRRLFMTVDPWVEGRFRGSRGVVSLNFAPVSSAETNRAWEGLLTFPPEIANPIQMVNGVFNGRDRTYMFCHGEDKINRLVEFTQDLGSDILEDGSESRISCQLITKMLVGDSLFNKNQHTHATLYLANVKGLLDWGVWARTSECDNWTFWRQGQLCVQADDCCDEDSCDFNDFCPKDFDLNLGAIPVEVKESRKIQFLFRWRGVTSIEGFKLNFSPGDPDENSGKVAGSDKCEEKCLSERRECVYNDYEYSFSENRWEEAK